MQIPNLKFTFLFGFLIGILFSGIALLIISNSTDSHKINNKNTDFSITLSASIPIIQSTPLFSETRNEGKININSADIGVLEELPGIGHEKAAAIITFRSKYGLFLDINELLYVPGIGKNLFDKIRDLVTTGNE
ncbi:MAG: competence protein ComEA [Chloroflexi bacterium]|nr:MAG: competence protein ComEA [Chloroflexota bacterium]